MSRLGECVGHGEPIEPHSGKKLGGYPDSLGKRAIVGTPADWNDRQRREAFDRRRAVEQPHTGPEAFDEPVEDEESLLVDLDFAPSYLDADKIRALKRL